MSRDSSPLFLDMKARKIPLTNGVDPGDGGYIPSNIWQGGMAYGIIPQYCEKLTAFCLIFQIFRQNQQIVF